MRARYSRGFAPFWLALLACSALGCDLFASSTDLFPDAGLSALPPPEQPSRTRPPELDQPSDTPLDPAAPAPDPPAPDADLPSPAPLDGGSDAGLAPDAGAPRRPPRPGRPPPPPPRP
jgi:hypothetical protein